MMGQREGREGAQEDKGKRNRERKKIIEVRVLEITSENL